MKMLPKIGLLLLMLFVLFASFVLPKFVQRSEPPTSKEDLAAALAAVDVPSEVIETETSPVAPQTQEAPSALRDDARFDAFFAAIDAKDFEAAGKAFLSASEGLEPAVKKELTRQLEIAVNAMEPASPEPVTVAATGPVMSDLPDLLEPVVPEADAPAPPVTKSSTDEGAAELVKFMGLVQAGNFEGAKSILNSPETRVDASTRLVMETALITAEKKEKEIEDSKRLLEESRQEMAKLQQESISQIQASVKELTSATLAAREAVAETSRLREEIVQVKTVASSASPPAPAETESIELPEPVAVMFGFDSTSISEDSRKILLPVAESLKGKPGMSVQLRGHSDTTGASDYNAILALARCEMVRDFLVEQGIEAKRISVVSFGKTQAGGSGKSAEELRRVDVIFRAE